MVTISYIGRFGNNLFQYVFGRLLAEKNGLKLMTPWNHPEIIQFSPNPDGKVNSNRIRLDDQHADGHPTNLAWLDQPWSSYHVDLRGYYQHPHFYEKEKEHIKSWMTLPPHKEDHKDDIVCHLRLGDYDVTGGAPVIDKSWYVGLVRQHPGKRVYIVGEGAYSDGQRVHDSRKAWERKYIDELLAQLKDRNPTMVSGSVAEDFHFIRSFGTIVCANSTLSWWAAWLSEAKTIYTFERWRHKSPLVKLAYTKGMTPTGGAYIWEKESFVP